jgi:hypothetical protein
MRPAMETARRAIPAARPAAASRVAGRIKTAVRIGDIHLARDQMSLRAHLAIDDDKMAAWPEAASAILDLETACRLQAAVSAAHPGFDGNILDAGDRYIGVPLRCAGDENAIFDAAANDDALAPWGLADAGNRLRADPQGAARFTRQHASDLVKPAFAPFNRRGDNDLVRTAQAADRNAVPDFHRARYLSVRQLHPLAEYLDGFAADPLDRTDHLADNDDAAGLPAFVSPLRDQTRHLPDPHVARFDARAVDFDNRVVWIGDTLAIDVDAAEFPDDSDKAGAANAIVTRPIACAANAIVARPIARAANTVVAGPFSVVAGKGFGAAEQRREQQKATAA